MSEIKVAVDTKEFVVDSLIDKSGAQSAPTVEQLAAKIASLEQQLLANADGGRLNLIETEAGPKQYKVVQSELDVMKEEHHLNKLKSDRYWAELADRDVVSVRREDGTLDWRPRNESNQPLYPSDAAVSELVGMSKFVKMSPQDRAKAKDIRPSDLRDHPVEKYFGNATSTSAAAVELGRKNFPLYLALRQTARKLGLI
jgi:hypothetical protein